MKRIMKVVSNGITIILFMLLITMVFVVITSKASGGEPEIFGNQLKTVLSGSMEPTFMTGSIIAVKPVEDVTSLKENDVITFTNEEGHLVTHRIMQVMKSGEHLMFETKGDNNDAIDTQPVLSENVVAVYTGFTIPYVGYFMDFAQSSQGTALLLIIPGILLLGYSAITIFSAIRKIDVTKQSQESEKTA